MALIPQVTLSTVYLIKSYLNIFNSKIEYKIRRITLSRLSRGLSSYKTYVSNGEFKHTNDKVIFTLYTYDRQTSFYVKKLKTILAKLYNQKIKTKLNKRFYLIKYSGIEYLKKANEYKYDLIKVNMFGKKKSKNFNDKYVSFYRENLIKFYKDWVKNSLKKLKIYFYHKQLLYINESKYNYTYLHILKTYIQKIYKKRIKFNLINLKHYSLNSDILSKMITIKISKNRKNLLKYLNKLLEKTEFETHKNIYTESINKINIIKNIKDPLENLLNNKFRPTAESLKDIVLQEIKYKHVGGVKFQISGRLTKRYTATRSAKKLKCWGSLENIYSSSNGISTVLLKGNLKPNLQYANLSSKTAVGSFGIKIWISGK